MKSVRAIFAILLVLIGLATTTQNSPLTNLLNNFTATDQADDSDDDDGGSNCEIATISCDFFHQQKKILPTMLMVESERSTFVLDSQKAPENLLNKNFRPPARIVPSNVFIAQIGLPPRAPSVI